MRLAFVNGVRTEPNPEVRGTCCLCGDEMISKCGEFVRWHWAHKARLTCDPWQESETDWHRRWKDAFPLKCQEVVHVDSKTQEKHIADVKTDNGFVVEVQHSPISKEEVKSRENFYKDMIWLVDARDFSGWFTLGMSSSLVCCSPMLYGIEWKGRSKLLDKWSESHVHVYFDTLNSATEVDDEDGRLWFLPSSTIVPVQQRVLWRLFDFDVENRKGLLAPVKAEAIIEAVMDGEIPPLHECDEDEAELYRRSMREVAGQIDDNGTKIPLTLFGSGSSAAQFQPDNAHTLLDDDDIPF